MFKIRGKYETSSVEKVNDLMKHFKKIRDADPIVALQRFLELDIGMCEKNHRLCLSAVGNFVPKFREALNNQEIITSNHQIKFLTRDKSKACITVPRVSPTNQVCPKFYTKITVRKNRVTGVGYSCTCKRHLHGLICDHVYKHVTCTSKFKWKDIVHKKDFMKFYKSQYVSSPLCYEIPSTTNLALDENLFLPTVCLPSRGRPKKKRYIGVREEAVRKAKQRFKKSRKRASSEQQQEEIVNLKQQEAKLGREQIERHRLQKLRRKMDSNDKSNLGNTDTNTKQRFQKSVISVSIENPKVQTRHKKLFGPKLGKDPRRSTRLREQKRKRGLNTTNPLDNMAGFHKHPRRSERLRVPNLNRNS